MVKRSADEYADYAQEIIDEMKEILKAADETALFEARKAAKRIYDRVPDSVKKPVKATGNAMPSELTDGTRVYVSGLEKRALSSAVCAAIRRWSLSGRLRRKCPFRH